MVRMIIVMIVVVVLMMAIVMIVVGHFLGILSFGAKCLLAKRDSP